MVVSDETVGEAKDKDEDRPFNPRFEGRVW
jgi:hypothetical protein